MWLPHTIPNIHLCYTSPLYGPLPTLRWFLFLLPGVSSILSSLSTVCTCPDHVSFASLTFSHNSITSAVTPDSSPTRLHLLPLLLILPLHLFCVALSFIPLLSGAYLHLCRFPTSVPSSHYRYKCHLQTSVHRDSSLTSSVNLSITLQTKRARSQSQMESHPQLDLICHSFRIPHRCLTVLIHVLYHHHTLL